MKNICKYYDAKYKTKKYVKVDDNIYKTIDENDGSVIYVSSFSFIQEPNFGEGDNAKNISQYPLEDILEKYSVYVSDFYERLNKTSSQICYQEFCSADLNSIKMLQEIVGKHIYNVEVDNTIKLVMEIENFQYNSEKKNFNKIENQGQSDSNPHLHKEKWIISILKFKIINFAVIILFLIFLFLQNTNLLIISRSLLSMYSIFMFIYILIILIIYIVYMVKYKKQEKKFLKDLIISIITLVLLWITASMIDNKVDIQKFLLTSSETTALITNIDKEIKFESDDCSGGRIRSGIYCCKITGEEQCIRAHDYYIVEYTYHFNYVVNNSDYDESFKEVDYKKYDTKRNAAFSKPNYNLGDTLTIYYNKEKPRDIRMSVNIVPNYVINMFSLIIIFLQIFSLIKIIKLNKSNGIIKN